MVKRVLKIKNSADIYHEVAVALDLFKARKTCSIEFIVEGTKKKPVIGIRYPGKKVTKRKLKVKRANSAEWGNLYDFLVIPYKNGKPLKEREFTFEKILNDFEKFKRNNEKFWKLIEEIYSKNKISKKPPKLKGIEPKLFLLVLKWLWIQEDFNYKLKWDEIKAPTRYILLSRKGQRMSRGAGRAKFFAALILLRHHFTIKEVKKIVPMYA